MREPTATAALFALLLAGPLGGCGGGAAHKAREFQDPTKALAATKPKVDDERAEKDPRVIAARPGLEAYLRGTLRAPELVLVAAVPFSEGHINETWRLDFRRKGADDLTETAVLKLFADQARADADAEQFRRADALRWPVPDRLAQGSGAPYSDRPAVLMEFVAGGTLETHLRALFDKGHRAFPDEVADLYGDVARAIGILHREQRRPRKPGDRSGKAAMEAMIKACTEQGWCGEAARKRFADLAGAVDAGPVSFIHGDLYESQVVLRPKTERKAHIAVAAFIDLDESGYGDPAVDLGSLLGHVLLLHPRTRWKSWGIPDPSADETRQVALRMLREYKDGARIPDGEWPAFMQRARGWMWLRLNNVMTKYRNSPQARDLLKALEELGPGLTDSDPLLPLIEE